MLLLLVGTIGEGCWEAWRIVWIERGVADDSVWWEDVEFGGV